MAFADDGSALYGGRFLGHMLHNMQLVLSDLEEWGHGYCLVFNPDETVVVIFSRHKLNTLFRLKEDRREIAYIMLFISFAQVARYVRRGRKGLEKSYTLLLYVHSFLTRDWLHAQII